MRILIDTCVIIDYIVKRNGHSDAAEKVIALCMENGLQGCIAAHTIPNLHYILRKQLSMEQRRDILLKLCKMFFVVGIDASRLENALKSEEFKDFEDCLQAVCAKDCNADYIITRNKSDFAGSSVPVLEPTELLDHLK
jgi:predicted nucleic acid-binding protein